MRGRGAVQRARSTSVVSVQEAEGASDDAGDDAADARSVATLRGKDASLEVQGHAIAERKHDDRGPVEEDRIRNGVVTVSIGQTRREGGLITHWISGRNWSVIGHVLLDPTGDDEESSP